MSGFENGSLQGGVFFQTKQFGSILRGSGPPVPQAGVVGDLYIDVQTWQLFNKRAGDDTDPWGHYLFVVPATYQSTLKWFSAYAPGNDIGVAGDYCLLWGGYSNYGMQPTIYGPKQNYGWSENGDGLDTSFDPAFSGAALPVGMLDEGAPIARSASTQLIVAGVSEEYILAVPVVTSAGTPVSQLGLQSVPPSVAVTLNTLYTAEDQHAI